MKKAICILSILFLASCAGTKKESKQEITVFAAASLADVIAEVSDSFKHEYGIAIKLNIAASGTLARQIHQGAEADIYLSANKSWMDFIVEKGMSKETSSFAKNDLVLISPLNKDYQVKKVDSLLIHTEGEIAIGDPGYVPAGKYATQVLNYYGLELGSKLFQCQNVRAVLMMVELGEVNFGIVYKTDALLSKKVQVIYTFPPKAYHPVEYYQGLISTKDLAKEFYHYLYSANAKEILQKYSFKVD